MCLSSGSKNRGGKGASVREGKGGGAGSAYVGKQRRFLVETRERRGSHVRRQAEKKLVVARGWTSISDAGYQTRIL